MFGAVALEAGRYQVGFVIGATLRDWVLVVTLQLAAACAAVAAGVIVSLENSVADRSPKAFV